MPILLRYVSYCLPLTMATTSLRSILTRGWNLLEPDVYLGFVSTISWIVLFLSISMAVLKFKRGWSPTPTTERQERRRHRGHHYPPTTSNRASYTPWSPDDRVPPPSDRSLQVPRPLTPWRLLRLSPGPRSPTTPYQPPGIHPCIDLAPRDGVRRRFLNKKKKKTIFICSAFFCDINFIHLPSKKIILYYVLVCVCVFDEYSYTYRYKYMYRYICLYIHTYKYIYIYTCIIICIQFFFFLPSDFLLLN